MAEEQHLANAPIKEALIDLRVTSDIEPDKLDVHYKDFADTYPQKEQLHRHTIGFEVAQGKGLSSSLDQKYFGYKYTSADDKNVVQFRIDGFTFSRLEPYQDWDTMRVEAKRLWEIYVASASPQVIPRIAVRYINALKLPSSMHEFKEYLTSPPEVPNGLPQAVSSFLSRLLVHDSAANINCAITQALEAQDPTSKDFVTIVLDIDAFIVFNYEVSSDQIWNDFERLHKFKNDVFFRSITDQALELFK